MVATITANLLDDDGTTVLAALDDVFAMEWQDSLNTPGTGSCALAMDDPNVTDATRGRFVQFCADGTPVFTFWIEQREPTILDQREEAGEVLKLSGRSTEAILDDAKVFHELGSSQVPPADFRPFNFATTLYDDSGWAAAHSIGKVSAPTFWRVNGSGAPLGFPDQDAEWVWSATGSYANPADGSAFFRSSFTLGAAEEVYIAASGTRRWTLYLDGVAILGEVTDPVAWQSYKGVKVTLGAGAHLLGAVVESVNGTPNAAGLLVTVMGLTTDGNPDTTDVKRRTNAANWLAEGYPSPQPGLTVGQIMDQLFTEAAGRTCRLPGATTWDASTDSNGDAWDQLADRSVPVGASLLDVLQQFADDGLVDYRMDPATFELALYKPSAGDSTVALYVAGVNLRDLSHEPVTVPVSRLLVKYGRGYFTLENAGLIAAGIIREQFLTLAMDDATEAFTQAYTILSQLADETPAVTASVEPTGSGDEPYTDFQVGNTVTAPAEDGAPAVYRVLAITCHPDDEGHPDWTLELNRRRWDPAERDTKLLQSLGTAVGDAKGSQAAATTGYGTTPSTPFYNVASYTGQPAVVAGGEGVVPGTAGASSGITTAVSTAEVVNSSNVTPSDVTGLAFALKALRAYRFSFVVPFTTAATTTGIAFGFSCPAMGHANFTVKIRQGAAGTDAFFEDSTDALTTMLVSASRPATASDLWAEVNGVCYPTADGTLQLRVRSEVNASSVTVRQGGVGELIDHGTGYVSGTVTLGPPDSGNWTVPDGVYQLEVQADASQGGGANGGMGGRVLATIPVTPRETLVVVLGTQGGGVNAGAAGGSAGGVAAYLARGGTMLVVAGGGGGQGAGGAAGGKGGNTAAAGSNGASSGGTGGGAATLLADGAGGAGGHGQAAGSAGGPQSGGLSAGGAGGAGTAGGGGGGSGYFGGGGGGADSVNGGGGGGGSSNVDGSAVDVTYTDGVRTGDGRLILTW